MKITEQRLRQLIREEIRLITEQDIDFPKFWRAQKNVVPRKINGWERIIHGMVGSLEWRKTKGNVTVSIFVHQPVNPPFDHISISLGSVIKNGEVIFDMADARYQWKPGYQDEIPFDWYGYGDNYEAMWRDFSEKAARILQNPGRYIDYDFRSLGF